MHGMLQTGSEFTLMAADTPPDEFGMCDDQFAITWMVNIGESQQR
jgi:uncharacterized glyoxalase superfamily protein PhnB